MHRWFFADEEQICRKPETPTSAITETEQGVSSEEEIPDSEWKFTVKYKRKLCSNEVVAITGNIEIMGKWQVNQCVAMTKIKESSNIWTITLNLPRKCDIYYRYLVCAINRLNGRKLLRFWETHTRGRRIRSGDVQDLESLAYDTFGVCNGINKIQRGWICSADIRVLQFRFQRASFALKKMEKDKQQECIMYVKLSLLKVKSKDVEEGEHSSKLSCSLSKASTIRQESSEQTFAKPLAFCEVANVARVNGSALHYQPKYGTPCGPDDILLFHLTLDDMLNTAYLVDLYTYPAKVSEDIPPYHFAYQHILPQQLTNSEGILKLNIVCATKHQPIGTMTVEYLLIKPLCTVDFSMQESFENQLLRKKSCLDIGHRGCGKSFWHQRDILRENTIKSFSKAYEHGADFIELDVQLTCDKVAIVYHDFQLYISRQDEVNRDEFDVVKLHLEANEVNNLKRYAKTLKSGLIAIPLNKFQLQHFKEVTIYEASLDMPSTSSATMCHKDTSLNLPFPTLELLLKKLPLKLGFVIDIKWPQKIRKNFHYEENFTPDMDKNEYVDIILDTVLRRAANRQIIFSSFDPDICTMIRLKQNRYPVMFIVNKLEQEPKYLDLRCNSLLQASYFAESMEFFGIIADAENILEISEEIHNIQKRNIRIFGWGDTARSEQCRRSLRAVDVDGIIFDRINHVTDVEDLKQTIILIDLIEKARKMSI
ncbi:glycerophosphocholine phosphodiesterase GPCPD1-like [Musca autumnalis]|uniref:glycerophosphocholine phosphodiesterase GPCPD1-like n=1 Tax=Musca autumnalis TaxID=221902 RepID=UPI003CF0F456